MTGKREVERLLENLESDGGRDSRRPLPPEQRRRLEAAFRAVDEPVDPEELAQRFVYGPQESDDVELTDAEAAAFRTVDWRERYGEDPPWEDSP